jgi:single-strand DNA-binding protein
MSNADSTIIGNLTSDPELKFASNGSARLTFSLASNRRYQKNGEWQEETSFFNCVAWRNTAEHAARVLEKGLPVVVKGRLEQRTWEDKETGQKRSTVELIADTIAVNSYGIASLERQRGGVSGSNSEGSSRPMAGAAAGNYPSSDPFEEF